MKKTGIGIKIICACVLLLLVVYAGGCYYYGNHFQRGTLIDQVDVSNLTVQDLADRVDAYFLRIQERKSDGSSYEESIDGKAIDLSYASTEPLQQILREQNQYLWFLPQHAEHETEALLSYNKEKLTQAVQALKGFEEDFAQAPTNAHISEYTPETGFSIVAETQGNELDQAKTLEVISNAVEELKGLVDLDAEGCYETPAVTSDSEELQNTLQKLQKYGTVTITYRFGDNIEVLDGSTISTWLEVDGFAVTLDQTQVENYVATLRKKYDSIFRSRTFMTSYGKEITVDGGDYGWWMNYQQEAKELAAQIETGESGERTPVYYQTAASYGAPDYGDTYVEINLTAQHLFFYKDGQLVMESDFVSGNSARGYDTPEGTYSITYKQRNATLVGENYETPVSYWMPFNKNIGMHDATWRSSFGGTIYKTKGSHGCINMPYEKAQELYGYIEKGTPVICYHLAGTERFTESELEK